MREVRAAVAVSAASGATAARSGSRQLRPRRGVAGGRQQAQLGARDQKGGVYVECGEQGLGRGVVRSCVPNVRCRCLSLPTTHLVQQLGRQSRQTIIRHRQHVLARQAGKHGGRPAIGGARGRPPPDQGGAPAGAAGRHVAGPARVQAGEALREARPCCARDRVVCCGHSASARRVCLFVVRSRLVHPPQPRCRRFFRSDQSCQPCCLATSRCLLPPPGRRRRLRGGWTVGRTQRPRRPTLACRRGVGGTATASPSA